MTQQILLVTLYPATGHGCRDEDRIMTRHRVHSYDNARSRVNRLDPGPV
jgi:hypothetical protein